MAIQRRHSGLANRTSDKREKNLCPTKIFNHNGHDNISIIFFVLVGVLHERSFLYSLRSKVGTSYFKVWKSLALKSWKTSKFFGVLQLVDWIFNGKKKSKKRRCFPKTSSPRQRSNSYKNLDWRFPNGISNNLHNKDSSDESLLIRIYRLQNLAKWKYFWTFCR